MVHQVGESLHQTLDADGLEPLLVQLGQIGGIISIDHLLLHRGHDVGRSFGEEGLLVQVYVGEHFLETVLVGLGVVDEMPQEVQRLVQPVLESADGQVESVVPGTDVESRSQGLPGLAELLYGHRIRADGVEERGDERDHGVFHASPRHAYGQLEDVVDGIPLVVHLHVRGHVEDVHVMLHVQEPGRHFGHRHRLKTLCVLRLLPGMLRYHRLEVRLCDIVLGVGSHHFLEAYVLVREILVRYAYDVVAGDGAYGFDLGEVLVPGAPLCHHGHHLVRAAGDGLEHLFRIAGRLELQRLDLAV